MSYDVYLQRFRGGEPVDVESSEVWSLLEAAWESPPDDHSYCRVRRGDDEGDLYAVPYGSPIDALMFSHAGPAIYDLMFEVATAGDMTIMPPDVDPFVVRAEQLADLPLEFREGAVHVESGADLVRAIGAA